MHILHNQKQPILLTATSTTIQSQQPVLVPVNPPVLNPGDGEPRALNSGCGAPPTPKAPIPVPQEPSAARVGASIRPELPRGDREARSAVSSGKLPSLGLSTLKIPPKPDHCWWWWWRIVQGWASEDLEIHPARPERAGLAA